MYIGRLDPLTLQRRRAESEHVDRHKRYGTGAEADPKVYTQRDEYERIGQPPEHAALDYIGRTGSTRRDSVKDYLAGLCAQLAANVAERRTTRSGDSSTIRASLPRGVGWPTSRTFMGAILSWTKGK